MNDLRIKAGFVGINVIACIFEDFCYVVYVVLLGRTVGCHRLRKVSMCLNEGKKRPLTFVLD